MLNRLKNLFNLSEEGQSDPSWAETDITSISSQENIQAQIEQGNERWNQGQIEEAIAFYRQAIQINPNSAQAHQKLAAALQKQGHLAQAMTHYRKAIAFQQTQSANKSANTLQSPNLNENAQMMAHSPTNSAKQMNSNQLAGSSPVALKEAEKKQLPNIQDSVSLASEQETAQIYLQQALAYCDEQKWDKAIAACEQALQFVPNFAEAYKISGNALQRMGQTAEAIGYYAKAVAIQPDLAEVYANLGSIYAQQQKWQQAVSYYQKAIDIKPEFAGAYRHLARVWQELDEPLKASECRVQALKLDPDKATAQEHLALAKQLQQQNQLEQAVIHYRQAVELNPKLRDGYQQLTEILEQLGHWQEASAYYRQLVELEQKTETAQSQLKPSVATSQKKILPPQKQNQPQTSPSVSTAISTIKKDNSSIISLNQAIAKYQQKAQQYPDSAQIQANLGSLYARQQQWQAAVKHYQKAIELDPNLAGVHRNLAKILEKQGQPAAAAISRYRALRLEPDSGSADDYFQLGNFLLQQEQLEQAITCYCRAIKLQPNRWDIYHNLGDALSKQEKWEEAIRAYQRALRLNHDFSWSYNNLGNALLQVEKWAAAAQCFRRTIKLNPDFPWSYYNLGEAAFQLDQWDEAVSAYRQAQQLQADLPEIEYKIKRAISQKIQSDRTKALSLYLQAIEQEPTQLDNYLKALSIEPDNLEIYTRLSKLLSSEAQLIEIDSERWEKLVSFYQQIVSTHPQWATGYQTLAQLMKSQGKEQLACQYQYQALQLQSEGATIDQYFELGNVLSEQGGKEEAEVCYLRCLELDSGFAPAYLRLGELREDLGRKEEALSLYEQGVQRLPTAIELHSRLSKILLEQQQWQKAIACADKIRELQPNNWQAYSYKGKALLQQENWSEAVAAYRQAIKLKPDQVWSHYNLGVALSELGEWEEVFACYQKITELQPDFWQDNPTNFQIQHKLGDIFFEQQKWSEAVIAYQRAISLEPNHTWSHYNLGRVFFQLKRWSEAIDSFRQATKLDPNFAWAYFHLGEAIAKKRNWDEAIAAYRRAAELQPDIPSVQTKLADILGQRSQLDSYQAINYYQEAIKRNPDNLEIYHKALELQPDNSKLYLQLANALIRENQLEQATFYYRLALQYQPNNAEIALQLDQLQQQTGQTALTQSQANQPQGFTPQPEKAEAYLEKGKKFFKQKKFEQAIVWFQIALEFHPDYGFAYFELGNALTNIANLDQALVCYRKAIELEPNNCWFYNGYGDTLKSRWDLAEAIVAYNRAIELNPDFEGFYHNRDRVLKLQSRWQRVVDYSNRIQAEQKQNDNALRILLVTPYPPYPPNTGGAIRMFEQIKYLGKHHHLTVVSFIFEDADYAIEESLQDYCDFAIMTKLGVPLAPRQVNQQNQIYHWGTWNMWKILKQLSLIQFDAVLFDFIFSAPYQSLFQNHITILNEHNIESRILQQCATIDKSDLTAAAENVDAAKVFLDSDRESRLLANYENQVWPKFTLRTVVSQDDKQELERRCPDCRTIVVKNGIDTCSIVPVNNLHAQKMLYMGTMTYYPNIDAVLYFAEEILPLIRAQAETIPFCIAGRNPSPEVQALTERDLGIEVVANPKKMSDVAQFCSITVVPIRLGSGTRIKILHAMAMGLPVISTSLGCEGLEVTDGVNILIRDEPQAFAEAVLQLSHDSELRNRLRANGRNLVEQEYDWHNIFAQFEQELLSLI